MTQEEEEAMQESWVSADITPETASQSKGLVMVELPGFYMGTGKSEWIEYQIPSSYDPEGDPVPMAICWHGYSQTVKSVSIDSQVDEECEERGWIFLAITGAYQCNFGALIAQQHCTKAIDFMVNYLDLNIDLDRLYMFGYSMGASAAASYSSRHLRGAGDGYPMAGLVLVSGAYDWVHAYYQKDPGVEYWLPFFTGGGPQDYEFEYRQMGTLSVDFGPTYEPMESLGLNFCHGIPMYITYADTDPLPYLVFQNEWFLQMLNDYGATYQLEIAIDPPLPHHWQVLDEDAAFDYIENFTLADQNPTELKILADRNENYYWTSVQQEASGAMSYIEAETNAASNALIVSEATNTNTLSVDCNWAGLDDNRAIRVDFTSTSSTAQTLKCQPISMRPTYLVDDFGVLYPYYSYSVIDQEATINFAPAPQESLKASFEEYNLNLSSDETASLLDVVPFTMSGGDAYDPYIMIFSVEQIETQAGLLHTLLINPFPPFAFWLYLGLDGAGEDSLDLMIPYEPDLIGVTIFYQFLTYDTMIKEVSNLAFTEIES
ncbi:MAG: hypothetical protein KJ645_04595 [Planctomycetes bacterium]|nr:hypothetical protein [Planctomycetota bacterium]